MTWEGFDRLSPDLTLGEIIEQARKRRLKIPKRPEERGSFDDTVAIRLKKLREALTGAAKTKPAITHMNRTVLLRQVTEFGRKINLGVKPTKKTTEFIIGAGLRSAAGRNFRNPTIIGAALGATAGEIASGKTKRQIWVDEKGNETDPPVAHPVVGAAIGAGAGLGAAAAHKSILKNYGGMEGGAGQAYKNVARNVGGMASTGMDALKKKLATLRNLPAVGKFLEDGRIPKRVMEFSRREV